MPDNLWLVPQSDNVDNKLDADCPSVPKCGSIIIVLSADEP